MKDRTFKESENLELKKSTSELKEAIISIAAILNKHHKGEIYFGIKNDGSVVGQDIGEQTIRDVSKAVSDNIEPRIYPEISRVTLDGKDCVRVAFQGSESPYFAYGRAYMRVGDDDKKVSAKELENLFLVKNKSGLRWDNKYSNVEVSEIEEALLKKYVEKGQSAGRINFDYKDVKTTLRKLKLITNNRILNAAEVLFCEDNPLEVQAAVFAGTDKTTFLDIKVFRGTLFDILRQCELYISERMNWRVEFKDFKRVEIPEIPVDAIREALVNSLCHRDYFRAESNKVAIFRDRIKIYNPGEFTARFEPSDYIHGDAESVHRNPLISEILYFSKDVERWGTGIRRIYDECTENDVKVEFKKEKGGFSTIFYRIPESGEDLVGTTVNQFPEKVPRKSSQKILTIMRENPRVTIAELAQIIGLSDRAVKKNIKKLKEEGLLKRVGPDKGGYWEVVGK
jgi:ATP-dependent DNA helicase RecG